MQLDEHKAIKDAARATRAEALLNDDLLKEAFGDLETAYIDEMLNTGVTQSDSYKRDRLHQAVHILRKVKDHLKKIVEGGKMARADLKEIEGKRPRAA